MLAQHALELKLLINSACFYIAVFDSLGMPVAEAGVASWVRKSQP